MRGALSMSVLVVILISFIRGHRMEWPPSIVPLREAVGRLPLSLFFGLIAGLIFYYVPGDGGKNVVCPKCDKVKSKDSERQCSCGGHFEDAETMKWV